MDKRDDLTCLRGIAVLGVLFFHAQVDFLSGGYVGVDVFFVLSGFLISNSIQSCIINKNFNFLEFYLRRAARIFPAAITVLVVVWFVGRQVLFPEELSELAESISSFLILKNNFWAAESISYFGIELNQKPLIHYWSLTIEIQFYIVFPLIVRSFLRANNRKLLLVILIAILIGSFIYTYINASKNLEKAYFSSVMRVWEFTLGAVASMLIFPKKLAFENTIIQNFVPVVGYALIIGSFFLFDNSSGFPGALALFPCVGTALILLSGQGNLFINKLFINKPLMIIGTISFSLYLIHQPLMAYYRILSGRNFEYYETYVLMLMSFFFGWVLYRFVESPPVVQRAGLNSLVLYALIAILGGFTAYDVIRTTNKTQDDFILSSDVKTYLNYRYDNNPRIAECRVDNVIIDPDGACLYGEKNNSKIALWGDSHADQIVYPLAKAFSKHGYSVLEYAIAGCPPITNVESPNSNRKCNENSRVILDHLVNNNEVHYVLLHAYWIGYFNENLILPPDGLTIKESLEYVVNTLTKSGKEVFIIDSVPKMKVNPPLYMARRALLKHVASNDIFLEGREYEEQAGSINQMLSSIVPRENMLKISDLLFDSKSDRYFAVKAGVVLYRDDNHLSLSGAKLISEALVDRILHKKDYDRKISELN